MARNFYRKVAFGIAPGQQVPDAPLNWAQNQVEAVPKLPWRGAVPTGAELLTKYAEYVYTDRRILRKKYKTDRAGYKGARKDLKIKVGEFFYENLELAIRHDAALRSGAPVFERLWWFWCNHFAITEKDYMPEFVTGAYHREVIRENLCGSFENLVKEVTISWAMIHNLDNSVSVAPNSERAQKRRAKGEPATVNENHARELLELHTVSPAAGYTQADVVALSYIMAGWEHPSSTTREECNPVKFNQKKHEPGTHKVLDGEYKQKGINSSNKLFEVIHDLSKHESTKKFIATKLCKHFICDNPTEEMISPIIEKWEESSGDLKEIHKALLAVAHAHADKEEKFQNPEVWLLQAVNITGASWPPPPEEMVYDYKSFPTKGQRAPEIWLKEIGLNPYRAKQPNGWPETMAEWVSPELLIRRFAFARLLTLKKLQDKPTFNDLLNANFDNIDEIRSKLKIKENDGETKSLNKSLIKLLSSKWMLVA